MRSWWEALALNSRSRASRSAPVLSFWLAYVLTRPLGANMGDWLALTKAEGGLNLGTPGTSVVFLSAILATVVYLLIKRPDVTENRPEAQVQERRPARERRMLGYYGIVAVVAATVLIIANSRPHAQVAAEGEGGAPVEQLTPQQATADFPAADISQLRTIVQDTLDLVDTGDQAGATARIKELETTWDDAQQRLKPLNGTSWTFLDSEIDDALSAVRAAGPDGAAEQQALTALVTSLTP